MSTTVTNGHTDRILIIDDDLMVSKSIEKMLCAKGYKVTVANSGEEGVRLVNENSFDLIISDIKMPNQNGVETVGKIKELLRTSGRQSGFMFVTGWADDQLAQNAASLGMAEFIMKPFDIDQFIATVERELTLHRQNLQESTPSHEIVPENSLIGKWKFPHAKFTFEKPILLKETNIMGNTYYDNYVTWQGEARERLLLQHPNVGDWMKANPHIKMITHSTHHRFFKETTFGDLVRIEATTREVKHCSFLMIFRFFDVRQSILLGEGWQRICFSDVKNSKLSPIPRLILDLILPIQEQGVIIPKPR